MPRKPNPDLIKPWKTNLPATLAGKIEYLLFDPIHGTPIYGSRGYLIERLLNYWLNRVESGGTALLQDAVEEFLDGKTDNEGLRKALLRDVQLQRLPTLEEIRDVKS